jgi:hypothetical protein
MTLIDLLLVSVVLLFGSLLLSPWFWRWFRPGCGFSALSGVLSCGMPINAEILGYGVGWFTGCNPLSDLVL